MKLKNAYILYAALIICLVIAAVQNYNNHCIITKLAATITEQEKTISKLENENEVARENCSKVTKGYAMVVYDVSEMMQNLDEYYYKPELLMLEAGIIMSRTERFMERKNVLLEEMGLDVDKMRAEINEIIEMREN